MHGNTRYHFQRLNPASHRPPSHRFAFQSTRSATIHPIHKPRAFVRGNISLPAEAGLRQPLGCRDVLTDGISLTCNY
ncbi:hypothetical protein DSM100238_0652 [Bifidobacterium apri]|uniref:Uncharacterized protein n=1 Tax=Bifidobacterium apri TaxID=1769423 RepID=A0A6A2V996_9BIFI|nr:hypothetical protein DSM100238_0652 [Bifidobacterium apri]